MEATQPVSATLRDSRNNIVATQTLTPDSLGTVSGDFGLAAEPPLGSYRIELAIDGAIHSQSLRVEAYRKPEYQVAVTATVPYAVAGDTVPLTVQAGYFFGQPVAGAEVVLKIYRREHYDYWWAPGDGTQIGELRGVTDHDGRWATTYDTAATVGRDADYTFVATVTDASQQPVEGRLALPVYWNTFALALSTDRYGYEPGQPVVARIAARGYDGAPRAGATVAVSVEKSYPAYVVIAHQDVTTGADGAAQATFTDLPEGWYTLTAKTADGRGREVLARGYLWIYDRAGGGWYSSDRELTITADRQSYAPGDTAHLLIESRVKGICVAHPGARRGARGTGGAT